MCEAMMLGTTMLNGAVVGSEAAGLAGSVAGVTTTSGLFGTGGVASLAQTAGTLSTAASLGGLGLSAVGAAQQSATANAAANAQSQIAANNAATAENEKRYALATAEKNAQAKRRETAQVIGSQRAAMGASGAVVDQGSFMDLTLDTVERGEMDAQALLDEGDRAAWRAQNQADNFSAQSQIYSQSKTSPLASVTGSLLSGAGQIGSNWYKMTKGKGWG